MTLEQFGGGFSDGAVVDGAAPVWTVGLGSSGVIHLSGTSDADEPHPNLKVMWIIGPDVHVPVTVSGREVTTGLPVWFAIYPSSMSADEPGIRYSTALSLEPGGVPNRGYADNKQGAWAIWGIGVGADTAGCYAITVGAGHVSWSARVAIGA